ncbi:hypothetical protein L207DRAFT_266434 [Hyaloscypha variabilis F]|uniref:Uncharacterized protein n=1 Tax=Hyaloscypha variabilis (strain UAMH 11265 / GT02V1 / F) TaxID=1149755 RepID=A0A2J6RZ77_HYAVF|nr:hypothetical protein L207DRAFT_266434 [Hyaloscypha variabilis F]
MVQISPSERTGSLPLQFITVEPKRQRPVANIHAVRSRARKYAIHEKHKRNSSSSTEGKQHRLLQPSAVSPIVERTRQRQISPRTILGEGRVDPFESYPVKADIHVHRLVDYCAQVGRQIATAAQIEEGKISRRNRLLTEWLPLTMKNEMSFCSLLTTCEVSLQHCSGNFPWTPLALQLSLKSILLLRNEMSKPRKEVSDAMIAAVISMAAQEIILNSSPEKLRIHVNGLEQLVRSRGGITSLEGIMGDQIAWVKQASGLLLANTVMGENDVTARATTAASRSYSAGLDHIIERFLHFPKDFWIEES